MSCARRPPTQCVVDSESIRLETKLSLIKRSIDEACLEVGSFNSAMVTEPLPSFSFGKVHVCFAGSTNVGKSSLLNGVIAGNSDAPFCATNIKAETVHCTEFNFGLDQSCFHIDDQSIPKNTFFDRLRKIQKRCMGSSVDSNQVTNIKVTVPPSPYFDTNGLAVVVDTPGVTEDPAMFDAVLQRLKTFPDVDLSVLVYCISLGSGLSMRPGMELSIHDKMFIDAAGIPPHRIILVATHYDRFVDEQKAEVESDDGDAGSGECRSFETASTCDDSIYADFTLEGGLSNEEKRSQAELSFGAWCARIEERYPGIVVVPFSRLGPKYGQVGDATPASLRQDMVCQLRSTLTQRVTNAHRDMLDQYRDDIIKLVSERLTHSIEGSMQKADDFDPLLEAALQESDIVLEAMFGDVIHAVQDCSELLKEKFTYFRERSFMADLNEDVYDRICLIVKRATGQAARNATNTLRAKLVDLVHEEMSRRDIGVKAMELSGINAQNVGWKVGFAYGALGWVVLSSEGATAAALSGSANLLVRAAASAIGGFGMGLAVFATTTCVVAAFESTWSYEDATQKLVTNYTNSIESSASEFREHLKAGLKREIETAVHMINLNTGNKTSQIMLAVQSQLMDTELVQALDDHRTHETCCICFAAPHNTTLQPCGHDLFCGVCIAAMGLGRGCPLCGAEVLNTSQK